MRASRFLVLTLCPALALGCSSSPPADSGKAAEQVKAVPVPAELVGKWRLEKKEGGTLRSIVYDITAGGYIEVDAQVKLPGRESRDRLTSAVTNVEGDVLTITDVSRTSADGIEEMLPPEIRRSRTVQFRVAGDELHWKRDSESAWVLTRVRN